MKILNVPSSSGISNRKTINQNFSRVRESKLRGCTVIWDVKHRITEGSGIGRTTIDKLNSSNAQMAEIVYIIPKGMIQS